MVEDIVQCPTHGWFEASECPHCHKPPGDRLSGGDRVRLSRYLSGALRHFPADAGLTLDENGWTAVSALIRAAGDQYAWIEPGMVWGVLKTDPKARFELDYGPGRPRVRATYGHTIDIDLPDEFGRIPQVLYHGTSPVRLADIFEEGLRPMERNEVHLSGDVATAHEVGSRHAPDPVILEIDAAGLRAAGFQVHKRGDSVYTVDRVPRPFLSTARVEISPDG